MLPSDGVLSMISLDYDGTIMASSGHQAEPILDEIRREYKDSDIPGPERPALGDTRRPGWRWGWQGIKCRLSRRHEDRKSPMLSVTLAVLPVFLLIFLGPGQRFPRPLVRRIGRYFYYSNSTRS